MNGISGYGDRPYSAHRARGSWASRFLDTVGDGTGSIESNVKGDITPVDFHYVVPQGKILLIDRLVVWIKDAGTFDAEKYGNKLTLANGIIGGLTTNSGTFIPRTSQLPVRSNADWPAYSFKWTYIAIGTGDNVGIAEYPYRDDGGPLVFKENTRYTVRIADDLTGLTGHRFRLGCMLCPAIL